MIWSQKNTLSWKADANGQLSLADNPLNQLNASGQKYVVTGRNFMSVVDQVPVESADKVKDSGWAPQLGASIHLTPNSRIYARYAEEYRLPSLFESTVGFLPCCHIKQSNLNTLLTTKWGMSMTCVIGLAQHAMPTLSSPITTTKPKCD